MVPTSKDAKKYTKQIKDIKLCHKVLFSTDECHLQRCLLEWLSMTPTTDQNPHRLTDTKYRNKHCVALSGYSNRCNVSWWETRRVCSVFVFCSVHGKFCFCLSLNFFPPLSKPRPTIRPCRKNSGTKDTVAMRAGILWLHQSILDSYQTQHTVCWWHQYRSVIQHCLRVDQCLPFTNCTSKLRCLWLKTESHYTVIIAVTFNIILLNTMPPC